MQLTLKALNLFLASTLILSIALSGNTAEAATPKDMCTTVDQPDAPSTSLVGAKPYLWKNGQVLRVRFLNGDPVMQDRVMNVARTWSNYANIKFEQVSSGFAEIRIQLGDASTPDLPNRSALGTVGLSKGQSEPTMELGALIPGVSIGELSRITLHEFGHALGFQHEHQSPNVKIEWNLAAATAYYGSNGWTPEYIKQWVFDVLDAGIHNSSEYDPLSIMHYPVPKELTLNGIEIGWNTQLSTTDKFHAAVVYPGAQHNGDRGELPSEDITLPAPGAEPVPEKDPLPKTDKMYFISFKMARNKCLDVKDHSAKDGAPLQLWTCTGENHQKFIARNLDGENTFEFATATGSSQRLCLAIEGTVPVAGARVVQKECDITQDTTLWRLVNFFGSFSLRPTSLVSGTDYYNLCLAMNHPLDYTSNGASAVLEPCEQNPKIFFGFEETQLAPSSDAFEPSPDDVYEIKSVNSGKCLDLRDWNANNGGILQQWDCSGQANQKYRIVKKDAGWYEFINEHSKKCVSIENFGKANGTKIHNWDCYGNEDQQISIQKNNIDASFSLKFRHSPEMCVDVEGTSKDNGKVIHGWSCNADSADQAWYLNKVD